MASYNYLPGMQSAADSFGKYDWKKNDPNTDRPRSTFERGMGFVTGSDAFHDIESMRHGVRNEFQATQYDPNAGAYQIQNQYGGDLSAALAGAQGRSTPQAQAAVARGPSMGQVDQTRGMQLDLAGALAARARGAGGPSVAELQMRRGLDSQIAAQRAQAASARGMSPGMAQRLAANNIAQAQQATNADAAMLRASEQQQAQGMLGNVLAGARGQDLGVAGMQQQTNLTNAQFQQQAGLANQQAELQNRQQMDQATQAYLAMGMSREEAQQRALADMERLKAEQQMSANELNQRTAEANAQRQQDAKGGLFSAAGSIIGGIVGSDERIKKNVDRKNVARDIGDFLDALDPASYDYKAPEKHGRGRHYSVMAQSAQKTKVGRQFVVETPDGLALDSAKGFAAVLAAQKVLHDRIKALEDFEKRTKRRGA
jgi:hypothetical protein